MCTNKEGTVLKIEVPLINKTKPKSGYSLTFLPFLLTLFPRPFYLLSCLVPVLSGASAYVLWRKEHHAHEARIENKTMVALLSQEEPETFKPTQKLKRVKRKF